MKAGGTENFPQGRHKGETRNIVGEASGFGSGKQYEKAKFIADNADDETIAKLDEGANTWDLVEIKRINLLIDITLS